MSVELNARALADVDDYVLYANEQGLDPVEDADLLHRLLNAASDAIYRVSGYREFKSLSLGVDPSERVYRIGVPTSGTALRVPSQIGQIVQIDDATAITSVSIDAAVVTPAAGKYHTLPENPRLLSPIEAIEFEGAYIGWGSVVRVTAAWGWPTVPDDIVQATIATVEYWNARDVSKFSQIARGAGFGDGDLGRNFRELPTPAFDTAHGYRRLSIL